MKARAASWSPLLAALAVVAVLVSVAVVVRPNEATGPPVLRLASGTGSMGDAALAQARAATIFRSSGGSGTIGTIGGVDGAGGFSVEGPLPAGPDSARVHRMTSTVGAEQLAKLADSLGLNGTARREGPNWVVRDGGAALRVSTEPGNAWTFVRDEAQDCLPMALDPSAGLDAAVSCGAAVAPSVPKPQANDDAPATPVPPVRLPSVSGTHALQTADGVLQALGLEPPKDAPPAGPMVTVSVDPVVAGLQTTGAATDITVDSDGIAWAHGWLGGTRQGTSYPLITAAKAIEQVAAGPRPLIAIDCPPPALMEVAPDGSKSDVAAPCPAPKPVVIVGADLGLSLQRDADGPLFVPAWLFRVKGWQQPIPMLAVDPKYLADPAAVDPGDGGSSAGSGGGGSTGSGVGTVEPAPPISQPELAPTPVPERTGLEVPAPAPPAWDSWTLVNPTTIRIQLTAGPADGACGTTIDALAKETPSEVYVLTVTKSNTPNAQCDGPPVTRTVDVTLSAPLGDRRVYDASSGLRRPHG